MAEFTVETISTTPIPNQKPGTSGLRKKVSEVKQKNYLSNFVQSIFDALSPDIQGATLVVGGDGRYYNNEALQLIIKIAAANGVGRLLIGKDGIFSTPAVSATIRKRKCFGGIVLTASHNPGGPKGDFGIKYNVSNGGPAPEAVTNLIYEKTKTIQTIRMANIREIDLSKLGKHSFKNFEVEIIDPLQDYVELMKTIFDFPKLKQFVSRPDFRLLIDSMHGVTGPYVKRIFVDELGASPECLQNTTPLPDFGAGHPDPNLTYAHELVEKVLNPHTNIDLAAAFDGDGDRNMVLGKNFFVTPSDSVAIIAANATCIPYFSQGVAAVSRSMPTSQALDRVAKKLGLPIYEVPTGWKFFGNLMDYYESQGKNGFICGEESFGTGSAHIREKDGIWAVLAWLSILEVRNRNSTQLVSVADIVKNHWKEFGRDFYSRYDYEECSSAAGDQLMEYLRNNAPNWKGLKSDDGQFTILDADDFEYKDPVDNSVSSRQGIRIRFTDGSRAVFRLSGTGSVGATIRVYFEKYEPDPTKHDADTQKTLEPLISFVLKLSKLREFTGRDRPTVIT